MVAVVVVVAIAANLEERGPLAQQRLAKRRADNVPRCSFVPARSALAAAAAAAAATAAVVVVVAAAAVTVARSRSPESCPEGWLPRGLPSVAIGPDPSFIHLRACMLYISKPTGA